MEPESVDELKLATFNRWHDKAFRTQQILIQVFYSQVGTKKKIDTNNFRSSQENAIEKLQHKLNENKYLFK